jgi:hypothetical protein
VVDDLIENYYKRLVIMTAIIVSIANIDSSALVNKSHTISEVIGIIIGITIIEIVALMINIIYWNRK